MRKKWNKMISDIEKQKTAGVTNIIVDNGTFKSIYWNYGDWSNPCENPEGWPNTTYAEYFKVDSFTAK